MQDGFQWSLFGPTNLNVGVAYFSYRHENRSLLSNDQLLLLWIATTNALYAGQRLYWVYRWKPLWEARQCLMRDELDRCIELCKQASTRHPTDWQPLTVWANACVQQHDYVHAVQLCDKAARLKPNQHEILMNRAAANSYLRDYSKALADLNLSMELKRTNQALLIRAHIYSLQYRFAEALADCDAAVEAAPNHYTYRARCVANLHAGHLESATKDCERALALVPARPKPWDLAYTLHVQALLHSNWGRFAEAIDEISKAIDLDSRQPQLWINRAYFLTAIREVERAEGDLTHAEELSTEPIHLGYIRSNQARIALIKDEQENALALAEEALALMERPGLLCTRAAVLLRANRTAEAARDLDRALSLNDRDGEVFWWKYRLFESLGETEEAEVNKQKALELHYHPYF